MIRESSANKPDQVTLIVNGQPVALNDFVKGFITETVLGMLKSLWGVEEVSTVKLEIARHG